MPARAARVRAAADGGWLPFAVGACGRRWNVAVTLRAWSSNAVQAGAAPEHPPPEKPANELPGSECAVSVTGPVRVTEQVGWAAASVPQSMPAGLEST